MGAKTCRVAQSQGNARAILAGYPVLEEAATASLVASLFPASRLGAPRDTALWRISASAWHSKGRIGTGPTPRSTPRKSRTAIPCHSIRSIWVQLRCPSSLAFSWKASSTPACWCPSASACFGLKILKRPRGSARERGRGGSSGDGAMQWV